MCGSWEDCYGKSNLKCLCLGVFGTGHHKWLIVLGGLRKSCNYPLEPDSSCSLSALVGQLQWRECPTYMAQGGLEDSVCPVGVQSPNLPLLPQGRGPRERRKRIEGTSLHKMEH